MSGFHSYHSHHFIYICHGIIELIRGHGFYHIIITVTVKSNTNLTDKNKGSTENTIEAREYGSDLD